MGHTAAPPNPSIGLIDEKHPSSGQRGCAPTFYLSSVVNAYTPCARPDNFQIKQY